MVSSNFFHFFLRRKLIIQGNLRQFLFEVDRVSIHGDIFKKYCTSHYVISITQKQKFTGQFHKFHIPLSVKKFLRKIKKVDAHRNVQV